MVVPKNSTRWGAVLNELGLTPEETALPIRVLCPLCQKGVMTVYDDWTKDSYGWFHCPYCPFSGDGVSFLARSRQCPELEVDDLLAIKYPTISWDPETRLQRKSYLDRLNAALHDGWQLSNDRITYDSRVEDALLDAGLKIGLDDWQATTGKYLRILKREEVAQLFNQRLSTKDSRIQDHVPVLPMWHAPNLPAGGFVIRGRDKSHCVYLRSKIAGKLSSEQQVKAGGMDPIGLAGLDVINTDTRTDALLIYDHPMEMVQDFTACLHQTHYPPAMISTYVDGSHAPLIDTLLFSRDTVFRTKEVNIRNARVICHLGGNVQVYDRFRNYNAQLKVRAIPVLKLAVQGSKPYGDALSDWLRTLPSTEINSIFRSIAGNKYEKTLAKLGSDVADTIRKTQELEQPKHVDFQEGRVYVDEHRWIYQRGKHLYPICDAATEIHSIRRYREPEPHTVVSGQIRDASGLEIPFTEELDLVERKAFRWLRDLLLDNRSTTLVHPPGLNPFRSNPKLFSVLACSFGRAKILESSDQVGWNTRYNGWTFPGFNLNRQGRSEESSMSPRTRKCAARKIAAPFDPPMNVVRWLSKKEALWVWGLIDATLCLALDRVISRSVISFDVQFLNNPGLENVAQVLAGLGCGTSMNFGWPTYSGSDLTTITCSGIAEKLGKKYGAVVDGPTLLPKDVLLYLPSLIPSVLTHWMASHRSCLSPGSRQDGAREINMEWFKAVGGNNNMRSHEGPFWNLYQSSDS